MIQEPKRDSPSFLARFSRLSLRAKGVTVLSIPMAALFAAMFSIYWMEGVVQDTEAVMTRAYDAKAALLRLDVHVTEAGTAASTYLATGDPNQLSAHAGARGSVDRDLSLAGNLLTGDPSNHETLEEIRQTADEETHILSAPAGFDVPHRVESAKSLGEGMHSRIAALDQAQESRIREAREKRERMRRYLFRLVALCGVGGPLGALFIHLLISGRLAGRVRFLEENARRLAHGLPLEPFNSGDDEIASLGRQIEDAAYLLQERERELRESEQRFRDLFDQAPIPYEETDCDGCIRRFNQAVCALLKCAPERVMGRLAWDFVVPDQQDNFRGAMMDRISRGIEGGPFECDFLLEDGSRIAVEIRENFTRNSRGEITGICRSLLDVTERNMAALAARKVKQYALELASKNEQLARALAAARSATEAKSRFLAGISHELRTPLNGIIGFAEIMHDGKVGPVSQEHREFLGDILTSARHLLRLINDILDLSKVEAGKMEFQPERRLVDALVYEVRDALRPLADRKNIELITEVPDQLTGVIDAARFKQILYNYLSNAVKFTPAGGTVTLRVTVQEGTSLRVDVADTGVGIEPAEINRLFQEFQQLPNSRKADQGTGLGLALTRHIVEAQGGKVSVTSELGRGSVFSAVLPLNGPETTAAGDTVAPTG